MPFCSLSLALALHASKQATASPINQLSINYAPKLRDGRWKEIDKNGHVGGSMDGDGIARSETKVKKDVSVVGLSLKV
jgi:hypothetical protein